MLALSGLRAIAPHYDAFLVDLWGVVHDGKRPFAGVIDALRELSRGGRRVIFVTNSSRDGVRVAAMLEAMGIDRELFEAVISSGDVTREALASRDPALFRLLPADSSCHHVGDPSFVPWMFELGLRFVDELAAADLVVVTGTVSDDVALVRVRERLEPAAARGVPLVCTNPDRVIPTATGVTLGPGAIAAAYAELGGQVFLYGKPHAPIYRAARRQLAASPATRVVAIGDLLETDIRGARDAGFASVLVTATGAQAHTLGPSPSAAALAPLLAEAGVAPDMLLERFAW